MSDVPASPQPFDSLPCAAWLVDRTDWHVARGNRRGAALLEGKAEATVSQLEALFEFPDAPEASIGQCVAAAFASGAETRLPARLRGIADQPATTLVCWPLDGPGETRGVGLMLLECLGTTVPKATGSWTQRIGHDLRGPVTPIRMAVQLLKGGRVSPGDQQDALRMIDRQLDRLLEGIQDFADLVRADASALPLSLRPGDLNLVVDLLPGRASLLEVLGERQQSLEAAGSADEIIADHDAARLVSLLEFLIRKVSEHAPMGAVLRLALHEDGPLARFTLGGCGASMLSDADVARVLGIGGDGFGDVGAKSELMAHVSRLSGLRFDAIDEALQISFTMPRQLG